MDATHVIIGARDNKMYCLNRADGKKLWEFVAGDNCDSPPVICGDKVVFGSDDGKLYLVRLADGKELWS